jgi:predicted naringenin-chalcone synthase
MSFVVHGIGTACPPFAVGPELGLKIARYLAGPDVRTSTWLGPLYTQSGVNIRHQVIGERPVRDLFAGTNESGSPYLPTPEREGVGPTTAERVQVYVEEAGPLTVQSATKALAEANIEPAGVTHLVTVTCTGFQAPGLDYALIRGLGLSPTVERTQIGFMGCHGALNGLRVAAAFANSDPTAVILLAAVELCSVHYYYGNRADRLVANAIFADGAAAAVGSAGDGPWRVAATGSCLLPDSVDDMTWVIGDHGFEMTLSRGVPGKIAEHLKPWMDGWLTRYGLTIGTVASWAVHPGGPKILSAVEEGLGLPGDALAVSRGVLADYGNMSSPTILFILDRLRNANAPRPCVALGFGPGLVAEATLFR